MFEQALAVEYGRTNRAWTTVMGMAGQSLAVAAAVLLPLVGPQSLPPPQDLVRIFLPGAPVAPPPPGPPASARSAAAPRPGLQLRAGVLMAPRSMPDKAVLIDEPPLTAAELGRGGGGVPGGIEGGMPGGILGGLPLTAAQMAPQPIPPSTREKPAAAPAPPPKPEPIIVGGHVQEALLIHSVVPLYPPLARQARISGSVELMALVGDDGRVRELQLVRGHPLLSKAALEAVSQWVYRPTYLNGKPVEVRAPITVHFRLN